MLSQHSADKRHPLRIQNFGLPLGLFVLTVGGLLTWNALGQAQNTPAKKPVPKVTQRKLPDYYGQLHLSEKQRQKVYDLQTLYQGQISDLEAKLAALRAKEEADLLGVLTPEQVRLLENLQSLASQKKAVSKAAAEKEQQEASKSQNNTKTAPSTGKLMPKSAPKK